MDRLYMWAHEYVRISSIDWREIRYDHAVVARTLEPECEPIRYDVPGSGHHWTEAGVTPIGCAWQIDEMIIHF